MPYAGEGLTACENHGLEFSAAATSAIVSQGILSLIAGSQTQEAKMKPKLKVWVVLSKGVKFGDGRAQLLELIDELGSIKQAVTRFGMSYRSAWGYLQELERAAGFRLLERRSGGGPGSGTRLTKKGREFLAQYRRFRRGIESVVTRQFARTFGRKM
jgi:molybdate transport system regulatory protein